MKKSLPIVLFFTMLFFITIGINSTVYATGEKEYAKYDSSDNTLTFFTSDENYTDGQVDGTITYYASFADTHYEDAFEYIDELRNLVYARAPYKLTERSDAVIVLR